MRDNTIKGDKEDLFIKVIKTGRKFRARSIKGRGGSSKCGIGCMRIGSTFKVK